MKKVIMVLLSILVAFGGSACNDTITQKEIDSTPNDNETPIGTEVTTDNINYDKVSS